MAGEHGFELRIVTSGTNLTSLIPPIVASAVDLLTSERLSLVKRCAECDWLFLDTSKNGKRRWCKAACGNRARSRERYERLRQPGPRRPRTRTRQRGSRTAFGRLHEKPRR